MNQTSQQLLLARVSQGDETAFKKLFETWFSFLAHHIFRITRSRQITEEVVQDVFLKIWLSRETLADIQDFKAYLVVVSRNNALNALRKLASDDKNHQRWLNEMKKQEATDPASVYYSLIDEAIDHLSPRQREIYLMHRHRRLTYNNIAEQLNLSRETVKSHLQSAIASISRYVSQKMNSLRLFFWL